MSTPHSYSVAGSPLPRRGVLAGGLWIVDNVKLIDAWPPEESLARIRSQALYSGGGPYNLLKDLSRLGARFPLEAVGLLGDDANGRWIREDCRAHRIDGRQLRTTSDVDTSYTDVMTVASSGRRTFFHQPGANALLDAEHFDLTRTQCRYLYLGYLLLLDRLDRPGEDGLPRAATVFKRARAAGMQTVLDCVSENSDRFQTIVAPVLPYVDVLFMNDFEAEKTTGIEFGRGESLARDRVESATRQLIRDGVRALAVVHFPEAVCACTATGEVFWQPSVALPPAEIAGCNGAGDALAAGVLFALHEDWPVPRALELGVCAAAASLRHPSCSDAVADVDTCLKLGAKYGFRT